MDLIGRKLIGNTGLYCLRVNQELTREEWMDLLAASGVKVGIKIYKTSHISILLICFLLNFF